MERKAAVAITPSNIARGRVKNFMMERAMRMWRFHFSMASDMRKPAKNMKMTGREREETRRPLLKYCCETAVALKTLRTGKRTTGRSDVTERGIASLIQRVAEDEREDDCPPMIRRTPMQRWMEGFSLSRGINITIIEIRMPMKAPMADGEVRRFLKGIPAGACATVHHLDIPYGDRLW